MSEFIGPCAHGRDPFDRCDEEDDPTGGGCCMLEPRQAEALANLQRDLEASRALCEQLVGALKAARRAMQNDWYDEPRRDMEKECALVDAALSAARAQGTGKP